MSSAERRCVISQPRLFPGLHYLDRMLLADVFGVFDTVQYNPRHEENRARIKTAQGPAWLTVPMRRTHREQSIRDTVLSDQPWRDKAVGTLRHAYGRAPRLQDGFDEIEKVITDDHETLVDLDMASWQPALNRIGTTASFRLASELEASGTGSEHLLEICLEVGATVYVSGGFGRDYLDLDLFERAGVGVEFHDYEHPTYDQLHGEFVPYLSYLDALFNVGLDRSLIRSGAEDEDVSDEGGRDDG